MKIRLLRFVFITSLILLAGYFILPLPSSFFVQTGQFPRQAELKFVPEGLNRGEKCLPNTVYYREPNGYTEIGEGVANAFCSEVQQNIKTAIEAGRINDVKSLISSGANVNSPNNHYDLAHPLIVAVKSRQVEIAQLLLDNGADVNRGIICCMSSTSALMIAVENDESQMVRLLLSRGADINFRSRYDPWEDVFAAATRNGNKDVLNLLDDACGSFLQCRVRSRAMRLMSFANWIIRR